MSHWNNFPACSFMTDFEIVVVQNERARQQRECLEQEQMNAQLQEQHQDQDDDEDHDQHNTDNIDNALLVNIMSSNETEPIPDPVTPIHPASIDPPMADATLPQSEVEHSKVDIIQDENIVIETDIILNTTADHPQPKAITQSKEVDQSLGNNSSSSGTYQSVQSNNTPPQIAIFDDELQEKTLRVEQIPFRNNDTVFMDYVNSLDVTREKQTNLLHSHPKFPMLHAQ